jgi:hypothetical protein
MTYTYNIIFIWGRIDHYESQIEKWKGEIGRVRFLKEQLKYYKSLLG